MSLYSVVFDTDSLLRYYFVEFGWIRSATSYEMCVLKDIWFRCASVSTFRMFAEQVSVFCELELIVPLDITTFNGFFMLIHLYVIISSNLVGFAELLAMKYVL